MSYVLWTLVTYWPFLHLWRKDKGVCSPFSQYLLKKKVTYLYPLPDISTAVWNESKLWMEVGTWPSPEVSAHSNAIPDWTLSDQDIYQNNRGNEGKGKKKLKLRFTIKETVMGQNTGGAWKFWIIQLYENEYSHSLNNEADTKSHNSHASTKQF